MPDSVPIQNISDTARWVAHYRALESDRPDAHFRDPFARRLAGEHGEEIVQTMPQAKATAWAMIVRTCVFDELILRAIKRDGVDAVVNLAAGLDARPYRMDLPPSLRWFEVDLPEILAYKESMLRGEKAVCRLERIRLDLADEAARRDLLGKIGASAKQVLVITEGLLIYLTADQVASLAGDLRAQPSFRWWIIDLISPALLKRLRKAWDRHLSAANSRMHFAPEEGTAFFKKLGWGEAEFRSTWEEARRLNRQMRNAWVMNAMAFFASQARREKFRRMGGCVLLERV